MSEENLVQVEVNETKDGVTDGAVVGNEKKGIYSFLIVAVFVLTVLIAWFGANLLDALVLDGIGNGFRVMFMLGGFYVFYALQIVKKAEGPMTLKEAFAIEKAEFFQVRTRDEMRAMTKEEKKARRKIFWRVLKFCLAVLVTGAALDLILTFILISVFYA